jgi:hypothetical protein
MTGAFAFFRPVAGACEPPLLNDYQRHHLLTSFGYPQQGHDCIWINRVSQLPAFSVLIERKRRFCLHQKQRADRYTAIIKITTITAPTLSIPSEGSPVRDPILFDPKLAATAITSQKPGIHGSNGALR